jgi:hypothetical protein
VQEPIHHNSSHFAPISDADLSPAQAEVIKALARGAIVTAAAEDAGVHRTTIRHWIRTEPAFKAAVELNDGIRELAARALLTLHDLLQDPTTPPAHPAENRARRPATPACAQIRLAFARPHRNAANRNHSRSHANSRCAAHRTAGADRSLRALSMRFRPQIQKMLWGGFASGAKSSRSLNGTGYN